MGALKRALPALLALLLLAGCAGQPAPSDTPSAPPPATQSPAPTPSPTSQPPADGPYQVEAHWDMLEERKTTLAERWYPGYTGDLIPSGGYGDLIPYIGGEKVRGLGVREDGSFAISSGFLYGFATPDGTIVTDAVYDSISVPSYYDAATGFYQYLPLWLVTQIVTTEEGEALTLTGAAAWDGSWYTGLEYRAINVHDTVLTSEAGLLLREGDRGTVMLGLDGTRLFRWSPEDFLPDGSQVDAAAQWFFDEWGVFALESVGPYWRFESGRFSDGAPDLWLDGYTGEPLDGKPADVPVTPERDDSRTRFSGGWYDKDDPTTLYFDDGSTKPFPVDASQWRDWTIRPPLAAFESQEQVILTDLDGAVLFQADAPPDGGQSIYPLYNATGGPSLLRYYKWDNNTSEITDITVFGLEGQPIYTGKDTVTGSMYGETVILVEPEWYLLIDLEGNELIRLPRVAGMDRPADE